MLTLYAIADELSIKDGLRHRGDRIVIPGELKSRVRDRPTTGPRRTLRHDSGQEKISRELLVASNGLTRRRDSRNCQCCANSAKSYMCHTTPLQPVQLPDKVYQPIME